MHIYRKLIASVDKIEGCSDEQLSKTKNILFELFAEPKDDSYIEKYNIFVHYTPHQEFEDDYISIVWQTPETELVLEVYRDGSFESWFYNIKTKEYDSSTEFEWLESKLKR